MSARLFGITRAVKKVEYETGLCLRDSDRQATGRHFRLARRVAQGETSSR
jgi:hypothetical protein